MPDNSSPAAQPDPLAEPTEFNFDKSGADAPRMKRRSLKSKTPGLKPSSAAPAAARDLEREAPPLSADQVTRPAAPIPDVKATSQVRSEPPRNTPAASPKTTPTVISISTAPAKSVAGSTAQRPATSAANAAAPAQKTVTIGTATPGVTGQKVNIALTTQQKATVTSPASTTTSPHGTRPATLYYTSTQPRKEATDSMKTTSPTGAATTTSSASATAARPVNSASATASAAARPATASTAATSRPAATNFDYRANVERQSREQKSVGSLLSYFVYGLIAVFLIGAGLATYGAVIIFDRLHDQSTSISGLDDKYAAKVVEINKQLAVSQGALLQAQAQIERQQDLINKEQEQLNQLMAQINSTSDSVKSERQARLQEAATLRARIRDLESKIANINTLNRP